MLRNSRPAGSLSAGFWPPCAGALKPLAAKPPGLVAPSAYFSCSDTQTECCTGEGQRQGAAPGECHSQHLQQEVGTAGKHSAHPADSLAIERHAAVDAGEALAAALMEVLVQAGLHRHGKHGSGSE